ncbi:hypothetical protein B0H34DRAFT_330712 [Crassisporium funariophilum]|nr:hypothetical protein B0H34DRAFT_330712 [Crassisporium funariophilum]
MDKSSIWTIGLGTLTISASSAFFTGLYGVIRNTQHTGLLVGTAALNSGITAATFFSFREFVTSPVLTRVAPWAQYAYRRRELDIESPSDVLTSPSVNMSIEDLRTNKLLDSAIAGAVTGGLLRGLKSGRRAVLSGILTAGAVCTLLQYGCNEISLARLRYISRLQEGNRPAQLLKTVGLLPVSDEEYLNKMERTREVYLKRIAELERQVEEEKVLKGFRP